MKKSLVWAAMCVAVMGTFSACDKGEDPVPLIVGTWTLANYELSGLPPNFTSYNGIKDNQILGIETGYTFVFKQDGTYSRSITNCCGYSSLSDKGTYTLEGTSLIVKPDDPDDLDLIDTKIELANAGLEFAVEEDITEIRMTVSGPGIAFLLPDDFPDNEQPTQDDFVLVDLTLIYTFNKLN